jgi:hypothetical protein
VNDSIESFRHEDDDEAFVADEPAPVIDDSVVELQRRFDQIEALRPGQRTEAARHLVNEMTGAPTDG